VVYLRPSTVSITVTSTVLDVLAVLDVVGGGGAVTPLVGTSPTTPLVGTSPARTVIDISPARATANTKRFMLNLLWN
jgi:hypothetical protein